MAASLRNAVSKARKVQIVTYAIENLDPALKLSSRLHLPKRVSELLVRTVLRVIMKNVERIAFGTEAARSNYEKYLNDARHSHLIDFSHSQTFPALEEKAVLDEGDGQEKMQSLVGFLGPLEWRKGAPQLLKAWRVVERLDKSARLEMFTPDLVSNIDIQDELNVSGLSSAAVMCGRPRLEILQALKRWHVLVMISQRTDTWREQIGLPILEGLSFGCEIVTSSETGIAEWLEGQGHEVIPASSSTSEIARAILKAIGKRRTVEQIVAALPATGGRFQASEWLFLGEVR
jgi:glycosyltransferase involved in cell wall biosynthesis